jgi:hypothetical protein
MVHLHLSIQDGEERERMKTAANDDQGVSGREEGRERGSSGDGGWKKEINILKEIRSNTFNNRKDIERRNGGRNIEQSRGLSCLED